MKKLFLSIGLAIAATTLTAVAAEEITVTGTSMCGKCEMKETPKCMNVLKVKDGDKETVYYMTKNMDHREYFCKGTKEGVEVTGTVEEKDGKMMLTPKKIEGGSE